MPVFVSPCRSDIIPRISSIIKDPLLTSFKPLSIFQMDF